METENRTVAFLKKNGGKRADTKHRRPALKTLDSNTDNVKQTTQSRTVSNEKPRLVQDDCFTPRRSLCRSPPSNKKPDQAASVTPVFRVRPRIDHAGPGLPLKLPSHLQSPGKATCTAAVPSNIESHLLDAIPPQNRRELPRTPICKKNTEDAQSKHRSLCNAKQSIRKSIDTSPPQSSAAMKKAAVADPSDLQQVPPGPLSLAMSAKGEVVSDCFTPSHALKRSPITKQGRKEYSMANLSSMGPPRANFELPRTPHARVKEPTAPLQTDTRVEEPTAQLQTDTRVEEPTAQLQTDTRVEEPAAQPQTDTADQLQMVKSPSSSQFDTSNAFRSVSTAERHQSQMADPKTVQSRAEARATEAPLNACTVSVPFLNPTVPCGLDCNENDISFIRKIKNVRQYRYLETQVAQLDKGIKDATAQKELLKCEAQKVKQDLLDMRTKYYETVASIQALISNPVDVGTSDVAQTTLAPITHAHVKRLRQVQQTVGVAIDKADKEIKLKVTEVEVAKEKLCAQLRGEEQRAEERDKERHRALQCCEVEKVEWQKKLEDLQSCHSEMEEKLSKSNVLLAMQQRKDRQDFLDEKKRAEHRLSQIIKRCEMCVQRHKLLKEMKTVT